MRAVIQVVDQARVSIENEVVGSIGRGFLIYLGVSPTDTSAEVERLWTKIRQLRIFPDTQGKTNLNIDQADGNVLLISQFTLYASLRRGHRPSFTEAAPPEMARALYEEMIVRARQDFPNLQTGRFGADMKVSSINDGPFTLWLDTDLL